VLDCTVIALTTIAVAMALSDAARSWFLIASHIRSTALSAIANSTAVIGFSSALKIPLDSLGKCCTCAGFQPATAWQPRAKARFDI
jgi:hypothetical protein